MMQNRGGRFMKDNNLKLNENAETIEAVHTHTHTHRYFTK